MMRWEIKHLLKLNFKSWKILDKLSRKIEQENKDENPLLLQFYKWDIERMRTNCDWIDEILKKYLKEEYLKLNKKENNNI